MEDQEEFVAYVEKKKERKIRDRERMIRHCIRVFHRIWTVYQEGSKWPDWSVTIRPGDIPDDLEAHARKICDRMQSCSCARCGHRRKWNGVTRQEKLAQMKLEEWLEELDLPGTGKL